MPRADAAEAPGTDVPRNPEDHGGGGDQHGVHLGPSLPQASAGFNGREVGIMRPEDAKKLLGGYATGTLTDAEQEALFAAALYNQELFDSLAREQSLRETLRDPAVKAELLAALDERP